jgi:hypothetical protein
MPQINDQRARWVQTAAAKHTTPDSIRRRIASETERVRILSGAGAASGLWEEALEARHELIRVLTKRLADLSWR